MSEGERSIEGRVEYELSSGDESFAREITVHHYVDNGFIVIYAPKSILTYIKGNSDSACIGRLLFEFPGALVFSIKFRGQRSAINVLSFFGEKLGMKIEWVDH